MRPSSIIFKKRSVLKPKKRRALSEPVAPVIFSAIWLDRTMDNVEGQLRWLTHQIDSIQQELENKRLANFSEDLSVLHNLGGQPIMVNYDVALLTDKVINALVYSLTSSGRAFGIFMNPVIEQDVTMYRELGQRGMDIGLRANNAVQSTLSHDISFVHQHIIKPLTKD